MGNHHLTNPRCGGGPPLVSLFGSNLERSLEAANGILASFWCRFCVFLFPFLFFVCFFYVFWGSSVSFWLAQNFVWLQAGSSPSNALAEELTPAMRWGKLALGSWTQKFHWTWSRKPSGGVSR